MLTFHGSVQGYQIWLLVSDFAFSSIYKPTNNKYAHTLGNNSVDWSWVDTDFFGTFIIFVYILGSPDILKQLTIIMI